MLPVSGGLDRLRSKNIVKEIISSPVEQVKKSVRALSNKPVSDLEQASTSQYPRKVQNFLNANSNKMMTNIRVCRKPLESAINKALDFISAGAWSKAKKKQNYDSLYHLYLSFNLGGKRVILDKSANITIRESSEVCADSLPVPSRAGLTLKDFLDKGRKRAGDSKFFTYNAIQNNCQDFLHNLLVANKMINPTLATFIKQDVVELTKDLPSFSKRIADAATKAAGLAERAYQNITEKYEAPSG